MTNTKEVKRSEKGYPKRIKDSIPLKRKKEAACLKYEFMIVD